MKPFLAELRRRSPALFTLALIHLAAFVIVALIAPFDSRTVTGVNPWIKPLKFLISIAIYTATAAWLIGDVRASRRTIRIIEAIIVVAMLAEIVPIVMQAGRGVPSHFNISTAFNRGVFIWMGTFIGINTVAAAALLVLFFVRPKPLPAGYLWGVRLGLAIFVAGSLEGFVMAARLGHAVGVEDGGPGLPFLNWSVEGGDLRAAHFFALHSLQALPLAGWLASRWRPNRPAFQITAVAALAGVWLGAAAILFTRALAGMPLLRL